MSGGRTGQGTSYQLDVYLGRGRHVGEIVHDHEHLDHSAQGVEESQLNGSFLWHSVSLLAEVDMALEIELIASPSTNCADQLTK